MRHHSSAVVVRRAIALAGLAAAGCVVTCLSWPTTAAGFALIGGSLSVSTSGSGWQRDVRVLNNAADAAANNNVTPEASHPGALGASLSIWKSGEAWNSATAQAGKNFDFDWQGVAQSAGNNTNAATWSTLGCGGGTLAFTTFPIKDGWNMVICDNWTWSDGPGSPSGGQFDIQGVVAHELGHALGLDHSNVNCGSCSDSASGAATMCAFICSNGMTERTISADDAAGLQAIYGPKPANKPVIASLGGTTQIGGALIINGSNFAPVVSVKFTANTTQNTGAVPGVVTNVPSTAGGTQLSVTVPAAAVDGNVIVWEPALGLISNPFPVDIGPPLGQPPVLSGLLPQQGPAGGFTSVELTGSGLNGTGSVTFGGVPATSFTVNGNTSITAVSPPGPLGAAVDVVVTDPEGSSTLAAAFTYTVNPAPDIASVTPDHGDVAGGTLVIVDGPSLLGVTGITFGGVPGTALQVLGPTQVQVTTPAGASGAADVVALGEGSSTLPGGFTYETSTTGSFVNIGPGIDGVYFPALTGTGDLTPGSPGGFTLHATGIVPSVPSSLFFSLGQAAVPFKGGTFYPLPILLQLPFAPDFETNFVLPGQIPPGTPSGTAVTCQAWTVDIFAPKGFAATNGLKLIVP